MPETGNTPANSLGPSSIIPKLISSLYDSANAILANFGLSIIRIAVAVVILVTVLIVWSIVASLRNRKSFSLHDEEVPDASVPESPDRLHGGVFRPTRGPEGSQGVVT